MAEIRCPKCNRRVKRERPTQDIFWCPSCRLTFDDTPDEGGTYSDQSPSARLEREESERQRKLNRLTRRD